ncbi:MAG: hypothetical protein NC181_05730 [Clostridium sp.]|nr:hypothetical protein [Clostridium sp.]MCM1444761.1 hypothetical protein [Candidatus Amulumruptor caecigallinarius]
MLDEIRNNLDSNLNLSREVKANLFELIVIFNNKFPNVNLENLNKRMKTFRVEKCDKFMNNDISMYDFRKNILYLNTREFEKKYDIRHVLMFELLNIITSNNYQMGFNTDGRFEALNIGYTEILANSLVGNNGEVQLFPEEATLANMISVVVGFDNMFNAYINNDSRILLNKMVEAGVSL